MLFSFYKGCVCVCVCVCMLTPVPLFCDPMKLKPTRLLCPWEFAGQNTGVGCHFLLQPRDQTYISCASCIGRQILYHYATREALLQRKVRLKRGSDPPKVTQKNRGPGLLSSPWNLALPLPFSSSPAAQGAQ